MTVHKTSPKMTEAVLRTARLRLVPYKMEHLDGLYEMSSDPRVMRYIGGVTRTLDETVAAIERQQSRWATHGFGWWSFFKVGTGEIIGAGCIQHLAGNVGNPLEIGWRLRPDHWGQGFASEAARTMAAFAFDRLRAPELLAVANPENTASRRVMERLGMTYRGIEAWYDTDVATYEITADEWYKRQTKQDSTK
jgi:RimJ/RimL family protein N-acetyltransferase